MRDLELEFKTELYKRIGTRGYCGKWGNLKNPIDEIHEHIKGDVIYLVIHEIGIPLEDRSREIRLQVKNQFKNKLEVLSCE